MVIEAIRLKLPRPLKTRFDQEFNAALAEPPSAAGAVAVLTTTAAHRLAGVTYHGQKTHEKKVLGYVDRARSAEFPEAALEKVCHALLDLRTVRHLRHYTELGRRRFPQSPIFPLLEAESYMLAGPQNCPVYRVQPLLQEARRLAEQLPRDGRQQGLLEMIREREQMVRSLNPFLEVLGGMFGGTDDYGDDWDDDDW
jgi:hypothetical protein